jgi:hypothetical protein
VGAGAGVTNDVPGPTAEPSSNAALSTICAYQSYASATCPPQQ